MKTLYTLWFMVVPLATGIISNAQNPGVLTPFANGLTNPVVIANAGDSRLFVVNEPGTIVIVDSAGIINPAPFLDITKKVSFGGEQGLLGLAFHPDYATNGYFYVNYIGAGDSSHISRFSMLQGHPDKADSLSEMKILTIPQPYKNHNGGNLAFGPDGYLYIALGDGGSGFDPEKRAQNPTLLLGKMLRIDVDHGDPYSIPESNPFYGLNSKRNEIWALGLRNPWKFSFDMKTGDLWIADVGQNLWEEIDMQPAGSPGGKNYGWRCYEGELALFADECENADTLTFPIYAYPHGEECSITGGFVYRGDSLSSFYGKYFFADYCSDRIWTLHHDTTGWIREDFGRFVNNGFSTFGEDYKGQLYIGGHTSGVIYRITSVPTLLPSRQDLTGIQFYNNPLSRMFRLELSMDYPEEALIRIYDMQGIVRFSDKITADKYEFDTGRLPYGVYLVNIRMNGKSWSHKLVVER